MSSEQPRQLTARAIILGMFLAMVLAGANAYLGLFAGLTVSASIPAAVLSMAVLRFFSNSTILENNIVQTAASAGESIAAGAIFTLPALILLGYWDDFHYLWVMFICGVGGLLGVLLTVPLRRALVDELQLPFPEGTATAAVLRAGHGESATGLGALLIGAGLGAVAKLAESGLRLWQGSAEVAAQVGHSVAYIGSNLSPALLAVGYIVGFNVAVLVFAGGAFAWWIVLPAYAAFNGVDFSAGAVDTAWELWSTQIRYMGVGAMLVGGLWALWAMRTSLWSGLREVSGASLPGQEDLPRWFLISLLVVLAVPMFFFYRHLLGSTAAALPLTLVMLFAALLFSAVAAYMAGLVGSSNNPVSGVTIATILLTALGLLAFMGQSNVGPIGAILVGAVVCCAAAIGGDNMQDLKAGALLGASPWRQQVAQMLGVISAVCVLAPVLSLLLHAYGIGVPDATHPDPLPAPQASLMAAVARGVFGGHLPWDMVALGAAAGVVVIVADEILRRTGSEFRMPVLAVAVGIYLPLTLSVPIALGGLMAWFNGARAGGQGAGLLAAAGLITGEALMGIAVAVPIAVSGQRDVLALTGLSLGAWPGLLLMMGLCIWLARIGKVRVIP